MEGSLPKLIGVDWSGAVAGARNKIWLAEARGGQLLGVPESGRDRTQLVKHLIRLANEDPNLIVGIDFAFSFPTWFLAERGLVSASDLWALAENEGDNWLGLCESPFWGRPGKTKPQLQEHFRRTDLEVGAWARTMPKSVFQIGGAGAVGTGSIRGMTALRELQAAGFSIWPFDPPRLPMVIEIWPRVLSGPVVKSSASQRARYLAEKHPSLDPTALVIAAGSDDAFDAAVSALAMAAHAGELVSLPRVSDQQFLLEGIIWHSRWAG